VHKVAWHFRVLAIVALGLAWSALAAAQSAGQWRGPDQLYATICSFCHDTGVGPVLKGKHYPAKQIQAVVRHGQNGMPAMRPSEFSDAELASLADMLSDSPAPASTKP
jgi:mono/diheme cytochrome c family protein